MVRASALMASQESPKTPHRIELCEKKSRGSPARKYRKHRVINATHPMTENEEWKPKTTIKKTVLTPKPLKSSNGIRNMTNGHAVRSRAPRRIARGTQNHKLTEYYKRETKSSTPEPTGAPIPIQNKIKIETKVEHNDTQMTKFYTVRRSVRKTTTCVLAEKIRELESAVREQREDGLQVAYFGDKGRGVIATRHFDRGHFVVEYAGELIGVAEARERELMYAQDPEAGCYMYYFRHGNQQYCIDATAETGRLGRLVNHSRNGNLMTKALWVDGPRLVLLAAHNIAPGDEITYDYGDRSKQSLLHHPWLAY